MVISLATPRNDDIAYHTNVLVVNALLKQKYHDDENIRTVEHTNMFVDGIPNSEMLQDDNYHLNARGTSALAFNIKNAIHSVLNLQLPLRSQFDRSRSRNAFRGRGRGRGYMNQRRGHGRDFPWLHYSFVVLNLQTHIWYICNTCTLIDRNWSSFSYEKYR